MIKIEIITSVLCVLIIMSIQSSFGKELATTYEDGTIQSKSTVNEAGILHGAYEEYFPNGKLKIKGMYTNGVRTGTWIGYDELGNVVSNEEYNLKGALVVHKDSTDQNPQTVGWQGALPPKQGLAVFTGDPEVEIFLNDKSQGKHERFLLELKEGKYTIEGRKDGYCSDVEKGVVGNLKVGKITLTPKKIRFQVIPSAYLLFFGKKRAQSAIVMAKAGIKTRRVIANVYYAIGFMGLGPPYRENRFGNSYHETYYYDIKRHIFGINGTIPVVDNRFANLSLGISTLFVRHTAVREDFNSPGGRDLTDVEDNSFNVGPRLLFQTGFDSFRFYSALGYAIRLDKDIVIFDMRNLMIMEHGFAVEF